MQVTEQVSVDINVDAWRHEFNMVGSDRAVAADVREYIGNMVHAHLESLGLLMAEPADRS